MLILRNECADSEEERAGSEEETGCFKKRNVLIRKKEPADSEEGKG